jgi:hypothetical protein
MWRIGTCSSRYPNGISFCPFVVGWQGIGKRGLKRILIGDRENLQEEFSLWAQALATNSSSIFLPQHDLLIHKHLLGILILGCVGEYFRTMHTLAPFFHAPISFNTTSTLIALHLKLDGYFLSFFKKYKSNQNCKLSSNSFKLAFQHMPHLSSNHPSRMVFEQLWDYFTITKCFPTNPRS